MLGLTVLLMIGATASPAIETPKELVKPDVAAARVAACGFKKVRPMFDDTLQENVVEVLDVTASADQLRCAVLASLGSSYYVQFLSPLERTYQELYGRMSRERGKAEARAWLEKRGLLLRLPMYDPKRTDETAFAHTLETICGPKAAGTLLPLHGMATFTPEALGTLGGAGFTPGKLDEETFRCLTSAATASGYPLGFIGNEATSNPAK